MRARTLLVGLLAASATVLGGVLPATASAAPAPADEATPFIVGGHNATETYSFMVSLQRGGRHFCGGSLVKSDWVVTARHCVQGASPGSIQARIGTTTRSSGGELAGVRRIVPGSGDIALLQLNKQVSKTPIKLAAESGPVGTKTRIIGWGQKCANRGCGGAPEILQELDTSIVSDAGCRGGRINGRTEICTDNPDNWRGACYGDSGGPQIKAVNGKWELIGATSRSGNGHPRCGTGPSIYVDVPVFRSWIQNYTGPLA
ncbi:serine protease [Longimycelium tulufanense]|uniref:Serine protease n=1 Tax=Longimycelium tulufanense TaxID=907463 RepID=A0A8J3CHV0_9PSEU|nr:serine protease [Longimycelium tulufanense]GGM69124.1 serine protease [Longimycelium tulufanense]